jgi:hypothetical protein
MGVIVLEIMDAVYVQLSAYGCYQMAYTPLVLDGHHIAQLPDKMHQII